MPSLSELLTDSLFIGLVSASAATAFAATVFAIFYSRNLDEIRDAARENKKVTEFYILDVIAALRKLAVLSLAFLAFAAFSTFAVLLYGDLRPALAPSWVFYINLAARLLFPVYVCLPALFMIVLVRRAKSFAGVRDYEMIEKLCSNDGKDE